MIAISIASLILILSTSLALPSYGPDIGVQQIELSPSPED